MLWFNCIEQYIHVLHVMITGACSLGDISKCPVLVCTILLFCFFGLMNEVIESYPLLSKHIAALAV